jgi:hypothetical protein
MWRHSRDMVAGSSTDCMAAASWAEEGSWLAPKATAAAISRRSGSELSY